MKRRGLNVRTDPRLLSHSSAAVPKAEPDDRDEMTPLARNVYLAPYLIGGYRTLIAVDSAGNRVCEIPLMPGVEDEVATVGLRCWLDMHDPVTKKADEKPPTIIRALRLVQ